MAALDTVAFHLVLRWHHFVDGAGRVGPVSDGLLHPAYLGLLVAGALRYGRQSRHHQLAPRSARAGLLLGLGGFQLFDGLVHHKLLGLHQVRQDAAELLPYDLAWNAAGLAVLTAGLVLARAAAR